MKRSPRLLTGTATVVATMVAALLLLLTLVTAGAVSTSEVAVGPTTLGVHIGYDNAWVESDAGILVGIVVADSSGSVKASVSGMTDMDGLFRSWDATWLPEQPDIQPGDIVSATVDGAIAVIDPVGEITGEVDFDADEVSGEVNAPSFAPAKLDVRCGVWDDMGASENIDLTGIDADGGAFTCDFGAAGWDLQRGDSFEVAYLEPDGDQIVNAPLVTSMRVNYGDDWVGGDYPAGHQFDITVKDEHGATKATAQVMSTPDGGWGIDGFNTQYEDWTPLGVDIIPGDMVQFAADDGYMNEVMVGEINGTVDLPMNGVSGNILAPWFSGNLPIECHPWGAPGDWPGAEESSAAADGSSTYECYWDPAAWDIQPGQDIGVMYREDDDDRVINVFADPAPRLNVEKWAEGGSTEVAPGGPAVYRIRLHNYGDAPAPTVTLTDTLPAGATYVADSSVVTPTTLPGQVTWNIGPVAEDEDVEFYLILEHTGVASDTLTNMVDIFAQYDWDENDNHAEAEVHVSEGQPDVYINKWNESEGPAPGGTVLYNLNYGNQGPVPAGTTTMTDTLPANTEVVEWYSRNGYDVWQGSVSNGQLILQAPAIPASWDDSILLRLRAASDAVIGTELINRVEIDTANDSNPGNNMAEHHIQVSDPYWNLRVEKDPQWGSLVAGGYVNYRVQIVNDGNMPAEAKLVDTLPEGTTYDETYDFADPVVDNGTATWEMGVMEPGERQDIQFRLAIDDAVDPETVLENCAEAIMVDHVEDYLHDNVRCVEDMVHKAGPNVRVHKQSWWEGENAEVIHYAVRVGNTGTTHLTDVEVIDTYPPGTTFNDNWWAWWGDIAIAHDAAKREIKWTIPEMNAGDLLEINFYVDLNGNLVGDQGLTYLNLVEAPLTGDVYPADNQYEQMTYSGADLYVEKWLEDSVLVPGKTMTFTVEFGNGSNTYWQTNDAVIADTLPEGLKYIKATTPWDAEETWLPDRVSGDVYEWDWGHLWPGAWLKFYVVVEVENSVAVTETLTNQVEIFSTNVAETDPNPDNDVATADVAQLKAFLPFLIKPN